jgi:1,2-diacylglycerol 3-alpha-glucosyltransferase
LMNQVSYSCVVCPKSAAAFDDSTLPYDVFRTSAFCSHLWQYSVALPKNPHRAKQLAQIEQIAGPDILHVHSPFTQREYASYLAGKLHIPLVATFHTKYYDDALRITRSKLFARELTAYIIRFYESCDNVWACSEGAAETLRSYGYRGDITVMVNGTNFTKPSDIDGWTRAAAERFNISKDRHNLLFVGSQVWQKNIKLVLDTMKILCRSDKNYRLIIAGCGYDEQAIKNYAKKLGLTKGEVDFVGKISDRKLLSGLFTNADLFFFPSVYDNSPLVLREASVLEVPSLLTKGSNAADVIEPDVNGFVAEETPEAMACKIRSVITDKELLKQVGKNACATIPVPWTELIPRVYEEYALIIDRHRMMAGAAGVDFNRQARTGKCSRDTIIT